MTANAAVKTANPAGANIKNQATGASNFYLPSSLYEPSTTTSFIMDATDYFFKNSDTNLCGYQSCTLYEPGCTTPYKSSNLALLSKYPYTLSALLNVKDGYQTKFCLMCENQRDSVKKDNIVFTQVSQCEEDLSPSSLYHYTPIALDYDTVNTTYEFVRSWRTFFDSRFHSTGCPIKECKLQTKSLEGVYSDVLKDANFHTGKGPNWPAYQKRNVDLGYESVVYYMCDNGV